MRLKILFIFYGGILALCLKLHAQDIGKYQIKWAITHPIAAIKVKKLYNRNIAVYHNIKKNKLLDTIECNGQLDAFRHAFFMACFAQRIKSKKLKKLGIAHEKDNAYLSKKHIIEFSEVVDSASTNMDLYNNEIGINFGKRYPKLPVAQIKDSIIFYIKENKLIHIK